MLEGLPQVAANLSTIGEDLQRKLFDAFNLELRYRADAHKVLIRITVKESSMPLIMTLTREIATSANAEKGITDDSLLLSAPCRIRTYAPGSGEGC
ncbi:hypothetical protein MF672_050215 [Actinomadura sp. ATCC 31491]|uniref:Uncharacterized protein n=1 Tax=Actinomadura luzonensis TaxID=2805427 RepID=A0ABT0GBE7_9ACTN|nr:hypothetical protein [Actinomadura luzonensis]MCK2221933.1 hypothetical protein [Actinomadura luzonensis]